MSTKIILSIEEQINRIRAQEGRSQGWIISKLQEHGFEMSAPAFSVKKKTGTFTEEEIDALSKILGTQLQQI